MKTFVTGYRNNKRLSRRLAGLTYGIMMFLFALYIISCGQPDSADVGAPSSSQGPTVAPSTLDSPSSVSYPQPPNIPAYPAPSTITNEDLGDQSGHTAQSIPGVTPAVLMPAPVLGVVVDKALTVLSVDTYSAAERAGIHVGDVLDTLDDLPIQGNIGEVKNRIQSAQEDQVLHLKIIRQGTPLNLTVVPFSSQELVYPTPEPGRLLPTATPVFPPNDYL
jgi:PDZ domain